MRKTTSVLVAAVLCVGVGCSTFRQRRDTCSLQLAQINKELDELPADGNDREVRMTEIMAKLRNYRSCDRDRWLALYSKAKCAMGEYDEAEELRWGLRGTEKERSAVRADASEYCRLMFVQQYADRICPLLMEGDDADTSEDSAAEE